MFEIFRAYMASIDVTKEEMMVEESKKLLFVNQILIFMAHSVIATQV